MDDDLFSTILYLVPVAAVLFFRVFAGNKKAQAAKDRNARELAARRDPARKLQAELEAPGRAVPLSRISGREPESQEWEPHWVTGEEYPEGSSRGTASPDEEGPEAGQRLAFLETETGFRPSAIDARDLSAIAQSLTAESSPAPVEGASGTEGMRPASRGAEGPFPGLVDRLPPLKRAVVLSEILGPPKGA